MPLRLLAAEFRTDAALRAFVVRNDDELTADAVRTFVKDNLARYKVPRDVAFPSGRRSVTATWPASGGGSST